MVNALLSNERYNFFCGVCIIGIIFKKNDKVVFTEFVLIEMYSFFSCFLIFVKT